MSTRNMRTTPLAPEVIGFEVNDVRFALTGEDDYQNPECEMVSNPTADSCTYFKAGHNVHFIQLRLALKEPQFAVEVVSVGERSFVCRRDGQEMTFYNHRTEQLQELLEHYGPGLIGWVYGKGVFECQKLIFCITDDFNDFIPCNSKQIGTSLCEV